MNLALVDPFILAQDCPEALIGKLDSGHAACIKFSHKGDLLASGRHDGKVILFDIETHGVARKLHGHRRQIQSLSWSATDQYLLSSSQDWKCVLWDLKDGSRLRTVRFEAPVFIAELHPANSLLFVAALFEDSPVLVDISLPGPVKDVLPSAPHQSQVEYENSSEKEKLQNSRQTTTVTIFSRSGKHILTGTNKGWLNIIETATRKTVYSTRLTTSIIIFICLSATGKELLVNSSDRIIRTLVLPDLSSPGTDYNTLRLEVEHKFQDVVNRLSWNHVAFSSSGEYVTASTYMNHDIYVWERGRGSLVKILEAPNEELSIVEWHPHRPMVAAVGVDTGRIYIWSIHTPQRWSALAPDFVEVEENVEYIEREDEFDIQPLEEIHKRRLNLEDDDVDVLTLDSVKADSGTAEFCMPVVLRIGDSDSEEEVVAIGTGQFRRKSPSQGRNWEESVPCAALGNEHSRSKKEVVDSNTKPSNQAKRRRAD